MNSFLQAIVFAGSITLPEIYLLILGALLRSFHQIDDAFAYQASRLMFHWALPALLFFSVAESQIAVSEHLMLLLAGAISALILFLGSEWAASRYIPHKEDRPAFVQGLYRGNTAIIGLAFCSHAYGSQGLALGAVFTGTMTVLYNILAVINLSRATQTRSSILFLIKQIIRNPLIIGIFLGFSWKITGLSFASSFQTAGHYLAATALPLALLCIGASFKWKDILSGALLPWITALLRATLTVALTVGVGILLGLNPLQLGVLCLMATTPVAAAAYVMIKSMGGNDTLAAQVIALSTLFSMISTAFWGTLLRTLGWI